MPQEPNPKAAQKPKARAMARKRGAGDGTSTYHYRENYEGRYLKFWFPNMTLYGITQKRLQSAGAPPLAAIFRALLPEIARAANEIIEAGQCFKDVTLRVKVEAKPETESKNTTGETT